MLICGLDSMVIGETQILGWSVMPSYCCARQKTDGTLFNSIFKQGVALAQRNTYKTSIGEAAVSVSYAAVGELGKRILGQFGGKTVMIIGAGKMSELTAKHLYASGVKRVFVVNHTIIGRFN